MEYAICILTQFHDGCWQALILIFRIACSTIEHWWNSTLNGIWITWNEIKPFGFTSIAYSINNFTGRINFFFFQICIFDIADLLIILYLRSFSSDKICDYKLLPTMEAEYFKIIFFELSTSIESICVLLI